MWWYYIKKIDDAEKVIYSYGRETKTVSGELMYNKKELSYSVIKPADGDTKEKAEWALDNVVKLVKAGFPDKKMIAIG